MDPTLLLDGLVLEAHDAPMDDVSGDVEEKKSTDVSNGVFVRIVNRHRERSQVLDDYPDEGRRIRLKSPLLRLRGEEFVYPRSKHGEDMVPSIDYLWYHEVVESIRRRRNIPHPPMDVTARMLCVARNLVERCHNQTGESRQMMLDAIVRQDLVAHPSLVSQLSTVADVFRELDSRKPRQARYPPPDPLDRGECMIAYDDIPPYLDLETGMEVFPPHKEVLCHFSRSTYKRCIDSLYQVILQTGYPDAMLAVALCIMTWPEPGNEGRALVLSLLQNASIHNYTPATRRLASMYYDPDHAATFDPLYAFRILYDHTKFVCDRAKSSPDGSRKEDEFAVEFNTACRGVEAEVDGKYIDAEGIAERALETNFANVNVMIAVNKVLGKLNWPTMNAHTFFSTEE